MRARRAGAKPRRGWVWIGLAASLAVGALLSTLASPHPDGLERVAADQGFRETEQPVLRAPLADYLLPGIRSARAATGLAGLVGTLTLLAVGWLVGRLAARGRRRG